MSTVDSSVDLSATLSTAEAAEFLGVKPGTLRNWRCRGGGPAFLRYGGSGSVVAYLLSDLVAFRDASRVSRGGESR